MKLYQRINSILQAIANCEKSGITEQHKKHNEKLDKLETMLHSGSGFDSGTKIDRDRSVPGKKIILTTSYHHMNDVGMYDSWTDHDITITPSFDGVDIKISGRDRNYFKDYAYDVFSECLNMDVTEQLDTLESGRYH